MTWGNATAVETLNIFTQRFQGMGDAALMALKQLTQIVHRQALVMGFGDAFFLLTLFYVGLSIMVLLLSKPANPAAGGGGQRALMLQFARWTLGASSLSFCTFLAAKPRREAPHPNPLPARAGRGSVLDAARVAHW